MDGYPELYCVPILNLLLNCNAIFYVAGVVFVVVVFDASIINSAILSDKLKETTQK